MPVTAQNATTLHLGVVDVPYIDPPSTKTKGKKTGAGTVTTGDVAGWLEDHYHIMEIFVHEREADIVAALEESVEGALESIMLGAPPTLDIYGSATAKIETMFRQFIQAKSLDGIVPGVPTYASIVGISHRLKNKLRPRRPSFIDTGLYTASFKSWVD